MAHYAFITEPDENGISVVTEVIVGRDENEGVDWESHYAEFRQGQRCLRTSYHARGGVHAITGQPAFRKNFAGIGYEYRSDLDAFIPPCPGDGWTLDEATGTWAKTA